ncbi:MAG: hypothetical protein RR844_03720 [Clostridium sp.]
MILNLERGCHEIGKKHGTIMEGSIELSNGTKCLIFAHYCDSTLFYKDFFRVSKNIFKVNRLIKRNLKEVKQEVKKSGFKNVWTKGTFSFYGDLRQLAVKAGFGQWGNNGIIENEKYGSNFLISAVFYK